MILSGDLFMEFESSVTRFPTRNRSSPRECFQKHYLFRGFIIVEYATFTLTSRMCVRSTADQLILFAIVCKTQQSG